MKEKNLVLVVDDTPENLDILVDMLRDKVKIKAASNGVKALEIASGSPKPDLILLDIMMPEMDGFEVCRRLKDNAETASIPVVFLTARSQEEDLITAFEIGAVDYVTKPFYPGELLSRVNTHLSLSNSFKEIEEISTERKQLIHILCHDLTNPIGFVYGSLELILSTPELLGQLGGGMLDAMKNSLEMIDLIRTTLALDEQKFTLQLAPVDLKELFSDSLKVLATRLTEKGITIDYQDDLSVKVVAEKITLQNTVINNILTNAVKFSYPDGKISVGVKKSDQMVEVSIRDYGVGIPPALANDLFSLGKATSRKGTNGEKGTGFGMPLVKKFMEAYGGDISVESRVKEESPDQHGTNIILSFKGG